MPPWELFAAAFLVGMSKTGFSGVGLVGIYLFTVAFGARDQVGYALPLLIVADLAVYRGFRGHGGWKEVWRLLPPCLLGVVLGAWLLTRLDNATAQPWIGGIILAMALLFPLKARFPKMATWLGQAPVFARATGLLGGVATTLANAAGPVIQIYLLARGHGKMDLLGTGARFFLLINLIKVPFLAGPGLITLETLAVDLWGVPAVIVGVVVGKLLIHRIPETMFRWMIVGFSLLAGVRLLLD